jgi:hypothetical protein
MYLVVSTAMQYSSSSCFAAFTKMLPCSMHKVTPIIQRSPSNIHAARMKKVACSFSSIAVMQHSSRSYYIAFTYYSATCKGCHAAFFDKLPHSIHQVPCSVNQIELCRIYQGVIKHKPSDFHAASTVNLLSICSIH